MPDPTMNEGLETFDEVPEGTEEEQNPESDLTDVLGLAAPPEGSEDLPDEVKSGDSPDLYDNEG